MGDKLLMIRILLIILLLAVSPACSLLTYHPPFGFILSPVPTHHITCSITIDCLPNPDHPCHGYSLSTTTITDNDVVLITCYDK